MSRVIGMVGLGVMGGRFAGRLLDRGFELVVYDAAPGALAAAVGRGATAAASPRHVADHASTVLVSLPSPEVVIEVVTGTEGLVEGSVINTYVDLSTTGPAAAERVAGVLADRGISYIDAPVSGGPAGAQAGTLTVMIAADTSALEDVRPILEVIGSRMLVVGARPGQAQLVKLINNLLSATAIAATAEALALGTKAGLDPRLILDVVNTSSGASNAAADKFPNQVLTRAFNHGFRLDLMAKDVRLCLEEASRRGIPMVIGGVIDQLWRLAETRLDPGSDCTAIVKQFEEWAGTVIASRTDD